MYYTLENFYKSKQWQKLLQFIKSERLNEQGEIICEHCGKPIVRAYDCIGHHKEELTEENVNDAAVSLNPGNIALVHHRCHNKIHDKLGYAGRKVYLVYGSPFSGKSTWVTESMNQGDLIIDMDNIWQCVSGCDRYVKPNRLKSVVFNIRNELLDMVKHRQGKWLNAYIIGGYPFSGERERLVNELSALEIFIDTDREQCIKRLYECKDTRNKEEWLKYIDDWWRKFKPDLPLVQ